MDPYSSSMSTSALAFMSKIAGTTLRTVKVASNIRSKKVNAEREVTDMKVTEPAEDALAKRCTLFRLPSVIPGTVEIMMV